MMVTKKSVGIVETQHFTFPTQRVYSKAGKVSGDPGL